MVHFPAFWVLFVDDQKQVYNENSLHLKFLAPFLGGGHRSHRLPRKSALLSSVRLSVCLSVTDDVINGKLVTGYFKSLEEF